MAGKNTTNTQGNTKPKAAQAQRCIIKGCGKLLPKGSTSKVCSSHRG